MKKRIDSRQVLLLILLLVAAVIPIFVRIPYLLLVCMATSYMANASLTWGVLGGLTGQIFLGRTSFMGLDVHMSTLLLVEQNASPWISVPLVFLFVGVLTALLLSPCLVLRRPYFSLVTTVFGEVFRNLMTNWGFAGRGQGLLLPLGENSLALLRFKSKVPYFYLSLLMAVAVYLVVRATNYSEFGYALKTVREDEDTANATEINPLKYKALATFASCGLIAVCGVSYTDYIRSISPGIVIQTQSVEFVLPAVIGGIGSVTSPLTGTIILTPLTQYLSSTLGSIAPGANLLIYAIVLTVVILFRLRGIMDWYNGSKSKVRTDEMLDRLDGKK